MKSETVAPHVSVIMPSYNHERFIRAAIDSVLCQTMRNIELIIVDDGSMDESPAIISEVGDPRVRFQLLGGNRGACEAMNIAFRLSTGSLIAVCNSDDEWHPDRLARQIDVLERSPGAVAVFSDVEWIGEDGKKLAQEMLPSFSGIFRQRNRSRWNWLRTLIETGNCLCHPSVLIRRDAYEKVGLYDNRFRQLPDMDMWIRVLQNFDVFVMSDKLVSYRIHDKNTSSPNPETSLRDKRERRFILQKMMNGISEENFFASFGFRTLRVNDELDFQIEKARYLLSYNGTFMETFRELGLDILFQILDETSSSTPLSEKHALSIADLHKEMGTYAPLIAASDGLNEMNPEKLPAAIRPIDLMKVLVSRRSRTKVRAAMRRAGW